MHRSRNGLTLNSSSEPQSPVYDISSSCQCRQCGEVIAACCLNDPPGSRDAPHQQVLSEHVLLQVTFALGRIVNGEESSESRRKSEESLYKFWEDVNLTELETSPWSFSLPQWVRNDQILRQILGLRPGPSKETFAQRWERIEEKYRDRTLPKRSPASVSSFTSFATDNALIQSPEDHCVDQQANTLELSIMTGKSASSSKDSQIRQPWRNSPGANERSFSGESSLNHYTINGYARDSPTRPFDATSLTPPASPKSMNQSAVAAGTRINTYPSRLGAHRNRRILRSDVLSQASEPVFFELDHSAKSIMLMASSWRQRLYQKGEYGKGGTKDKTGSEDSPIAISNRRPYQAHTTAGTTHKRKRMTQNSLPYSSTSIFTASPKSPCSLKRARYET